jgi:hypothetical protein
MSDLAAMLGPWHAPRRSTIVIGAAPNRSTSSSRHCPPRCAAKIDEFIEEHLNGRLPQDPPPPFPVTSQLDGELRELRVRFTNTRYRILYQRSENLVC